MEPGISSERGSILIITLVILAGLGILLGAISAQWWNLNRVTHLNIRDQQRFLASESAYSIGTRAFFLHPSHYPVSDTPVEISLPTDLSDIRTFLLRSAPDRLFVSNRITGYPADRNQGRRFSIRSPYLFQLNAKEIYAEIGSRLSGWAVSERFRVPGTWKKKSVIRDWELDKKDFIERLRKTRLKWQRVGRGRLIQTGFSGERLRLSGNTEMVDVTVKTTSFWIQGDLLITGKTRIENRLPNAASSRFPANEKDFQIIVVEGDCTIQSGPGAPGPLITTALFVFGKCEIGSRATFNGFLFSPEIRIGAFTRINAGKGR